MRVGVKGGNVDAGRRATQEWQANDEVKESMGVGKGGGARSVTGILQ